MREIKSIPRLILQDLPETVVIGDPDPEENPREELKLIFIFDMRSWILIRLNLKIPITKIRSCLKELLTVTFELWIIQHQK